MISFLVLEVRSCWRGKIELNAKENMRKDGDESDGAVGIGSFPDGRAAGFFRLGLAAVLERQERHTDSDPDGVWMPSLEDVSVNANAWDKVGV